MNASKIARGSHEEALNLVRRVPAIKSAWVYARAVGNFLWRQNKRCWAELRGNTLLLHVVGEQSSRANAEQLAKRTPAENIMMITLKESKVMTDLKGNKIKLKRNTNGEKNIEIKFKDGVETKKWQSSLEKAATQRNVSLNDFELLAQVGKGASGRVFLVKDRTNDEKLALKVIEKQSVYENDDSYRHALDERLVLEMACDHPFILNLRYAFQSQSRLYLVTEYCDGGDLFDYLKKRGKPFKENEGKRIAGEILLALEHIHSLGVVYRDLKLENVLLDLDGHVRIADFGLSKLLDKKRYIANMNNNQNNNLQQHHHHHHPQPPHQQLPPFEHHHLRNINHNVHSNRVQSALQPSSSSSSHNQNKVNNMTKTFCGTREYVAPEMLSGNEYGQSVDLWAFGILLYEILCGRTPFYSRNREEVYSKIENGALRFPRNLSQDVVSLIRGLLDRNPNTRLGLGSEGINEIKKHAFFKDMDWEGLYHKIDHPDNIIVEKSMVDEVIAASNNQINNHPLKKQNGANKLHQKSNLHDQLKQQQQQQQQQQRQNHHNHYQQQQQQQQQQQLKYQNINHPQKKIKNNGNNGNLKTNSNNGSSQIVDEDHVFGNVNDLLEDGVGDKKRPDIFAMFVATKKKATNIAGYSYMAPPPPAPTIAMDGIATREDLPN